MKLKKQPGAYYLHRRVPTRYHAIEKRRLISISLKTNDLDRAVLRATLMWDQLIDAWEDALKSEGMRSSVTERIRRDVIRDTERRAQESEGTSRNAVQPPPTTTAPKDRLDRRGITISKALEIYMVMTEERLASGDKNQQRIALNGRKRATANLIKVIGDKPLEDISPDDAQDFKLWWWERIKNGEVKPQTANREITQVSHVLNRVIEWRRLGIAKPLQGIFFHETKISTRLPWSTSWIKDKILAPEALSGLNTEARCLLLGMINTGYRPSEGAALGTSQIHLEGPIPYIHIAPVKRTLKTRHSERIIPLAGVSLAAFRECPDGFARYEGKAGGFTQLVNKYLRRNDLAQTPDHTVYGFRHSFEDRLLEAGVDERLRADFMGHKIGRERYGEGGSLEFRLKEIRRGAL